VLPGEAEEGNEEEEERGEGGRTESVTKADVITALLSVGEDGEPLPCRVVKADCLPQGGHHLLTRLQFT
jgi:hypothetical protein